MNGGERSEDREEKEREGKGEKREGETASERTARG
jgi:hypothetical protein